MVLVVGALVVLTVAAIAFAFAMWRRSTALQVQRSAVAKALDVPDSGDLVSRARGVSADLDRSSAAAASFRYALEGVPVGVVSVSATGQLTFVNSSAQALLDHPRGGAILRSRISALGTRVVRSGEREAIEMDLHEPERRVLGISAEPAGEAVGRQFALVYVEDLSERRRVDAMRSDFVANASHELKTPLGALSLLAETLSGAHDDETRQRLSRRLQDEASRMANVIDDILRLAESESLGIEFAPVSVADVMDQASKSVQTLAEEQGVELVRGDIADATVAGNRDQLVSAVQNLLHNAITYTAVKGEPGSVTYRSSVTDASVRVEVEDTGIGIPDRYIDRVFERFFRVDRARSRESGGTGLGLSIVRNVAVAHGGDVGLHSRVGVGSTFTITLPVVVDRS